MRDGSLKALIAVLLLLIANALVRAESPSSRTPAGDPITELLRHFNPYDLAGKVASPEPIRLNS